MGSVVTPVLAGFGVGIALGGAPGPVQAVLLNEASRGLGRGFRAMAGANITFGLLLAAAAAGFSALAPTGFWIRLLDVAGGLLLLSLAADGLRTTLRAETRSPGDRFAVPAFLRGATVVLLNPGGWLFLATVGASLFAAATVAGGRLLAVASAVAITGGLALGDATVVTLGGLGLARAQRGTRAWIQRGLAVLLAALGIWLVVRGIAAP
jgi:threonine/homoserine/homoserine lactone efflux protein